MSPIVRLTAALLLSTLWVADACPLEAGGFATATGDAPTARPDPTLVTSRDIVAPGLTLRSRAPTYDLAQVPTSGRGALVPTATKVALRTGRLCRPARRSCRRFSLELELGPVWQTRNEVALPGDTGTRFDLDDVAGPGPFPYGRLTLDWHVSGRHHVRALVAPLEISERGTLDAPISFSGKAYAAGVSTKATYKFNSYRVGYRYELICRPRWSLFVGATIKLRDANIALRQGATSARKTDFGVVPLLHVDVAWRFRPGWRLVADLDAAAAPQGRAIDFALKLHRDFSDRWSVGIGYRTIEGGADNDSVYTFTWLHQGFLTVSYRF